MKTDDGESSGDASNAYQTAAGKTGRLGGHRPSRKQRAESNEHVLASRSPAHWLSHDGMGGEQSGGKDGRAMTCPQRSGDAPQQEHAQAM